MTPAFLRASLAGERKTAEQLLALSLPADWPENEYVLRMRLGQLEADPTLQPWLLRAMAHRQTRAMVGHIGFHTAPKPAYLQPWCADGVEFGFTVYPPHRRCGYAMEASL